MQPPPCQHGTGDLHVQAVDLTIRQLRAIVAVADVRSFTAASRQLRMSQQSVSALVREVEARIGTRLFLRTTRTVEPTSACEALLPEIRAGMELLDAAFARLQDLSRSEPPLRLAITPAIVFGELKILLEALEDQVPAEPDVREVWADELLSGLMAGHFDAGLGIEVPPTAGLDVLPWRQQRIDLLVADGHPWAKQASVKVEQLEGTTLVAPGERTNAGLRDKLMSTLGQTGVRPVLVESSRVAGPAAVIVERGRASTVWLSAMDDRYLPEGLVRLPLLEPATVVTTSLVIPRSTGAGVIQSIAGLRAAVARTSKTMTVIDS